MEKKVQARIGERLSVYRSEPYFLEVMPEGIDKAKSLRRMLELTGMGTEDMMAFGDGYNDKSMIMLAGFGVAMENGQARPERPVCSRRNRNISRPLPVIQRFGKSDPEADCP